MRNSLLDKPQYQQVQLNLPDSIVNADTIQECAF
jgi:hypothetical protein